MAEITKNQLTTKTVEDIKKVLVNYMVSLKQNQFELNKAYCHDMFISLKCLVSDCSGVDFDLEGALTTYFDNEAKAEKMRYSNG